MVDMSVNLMHVINQLLVFFYFCFCLFIFVLFFSSFIEVTDIHVWVCAPLLQSCLTLCDPRDCSLPGSSIHSVMDSGLLCSSSGDLLYPGIEPMSPALQVDSLPLSHQGNP